MNSFNRLWFRFVFTLAVAFWTPLLALADLSQRMAVVGNPEVVVSSAEPNGAAVAAYCTDYHRNEPVTGMHIGHFIGDVAVYQRKDDRWVYLTTLDNAISQGLIRVDGIDAIRLRHSAIGRHDAIRILPGPAADGTYCVKFNSGAIFGEAAADVQAAANTVGVVEALNTYGGKRNLHQKEIQRAVWAVQESKWTLVQVDALTKMDVDDFRQEIDKLVAAIIQRGN